MYKQAKYYNMLCQSANPHNNIDEAVIYKLHGKLYEQGFEYAAHIGEYLVVGNTPDIETLSFDEGNIPYVLSNAGIEYEYVEDVAEYLAR
jgi:beta-xylosidase